MVVKEGRFGPVRHRRRDEREPPPGDDPESLTVERAQELLADRRATGPGAKKTASKKSTAKKPARSRSKS